MKRMGERGNIGGEMGRDCKDIVKRVGNEWEEGEMLLIKTD